MSAKLVIKNETIMSIVNLKECKSLYVNVKKYYCDLLPQSAKSKQDYDRRKFTLVFYLIVHRIVMDPSTQKNVVICE